MIDTCARAAFVSAVRQLPLKSTPAGTLSTRWNIADGDGS